LSEDEAFHREIDGESEPAESERLREELRRKPEAQARYHELVRLCRSLDAVPAAEPPPGLVESVMRAVRAIARRSAPESRLLVLREAFSRRPMLGLGLSFAAGLLLASLLGGLAEPGRAPRSGEEAATALPSERLASRTLDRAVLEAEGVRGVARVDQTDDRVSVRVRVESGSPLRLVVTWDGRGLRPLAFEQGEATVQAVALGPASLAVEGAGKGEYVLVLQAREPAPSPLGLRLEQGTTVVEKALRVGGS
jgi:hypothetical protein